MANNVQLRWQEQKGANPPVLQYRLLQDTEWVPGKMNVKWGKWLTVPMVPYERVQSDGA